MKCVTAIVILAELALVAGGGSKKHRGFFTGGRRRRNSFGRRGGWKRKNTGGSKRGRTFTRFYRIYGDCGDVGLVIDEDVDSYTRDCIDDIEDAIQAEFYVDVDQSDDVDSSDEATIIIDSDIFDCSDAIDDALDIVDDALDASCERPSVTRGFLRGDSSSDDRWRYGYRTSTYYGYDRPRSGRRKFGRRFGHRHHDSSDDDRDKSRRKFRRGSDSKDNHHARRDTGTDTAETTKTKKQSHKSKTKPTVPSV